MGKANALRELIREEVRAVFREELADILKEAITVNKEKQPITEAPKLKSIPGTLNRSIPKPIAPILKPGNPLNNLLAETARSMTSDDYGALGGYGYEKETQVVGSVEGMLTSARKSSNLEAIEINDIPDFSAAMAKMGI